MAGSRVAWFLVLLAAASAYRPVVKSAAVRSVPSALPVVLWHGMGDSCCNKYSIGAIKRVIEERLGVFVYSIATGDSASSDVYSSYFGNVNDQVSRACATLRNIPELSGGFNAVGFSQGGQFLRALVERCQHIGPKMRTLITLGSQHQGVMNVPGCDASLNNNTAARAAGGARNAATAAASSSTAASSSASSSSSSSAQVTVEAHVAPPSPNDACSLMQSMLGRGAYLPFVRDHLVQAQYFKDPHRLAEYLLLNVFLPDINNEKPQRNPQYKANLASLDQLVLFRFKEDDTVVPRDSAWFSFYDGHSLQPLRDQALYQEDWLGLRELDEGGRLLFDESPGRHMQFTLTWFAENVVDKYLGGEDRGDGSKDRGTRLQQDGVAEVRGVQVEVQ